MEAIIGADASRIHCEDVISSSLYPYLWLIPPCQKGRKRAPISFLSLQHREGILSLGNRTIKMMGEERKRKRKSKEKGKEEGKRGKQAHLPFLPA